MRPKGKWRFSTNLFTLAVLILREMSGNRRILLNDFCVPGDDCFGEMKAESFSIPEPKFGGVAASIRLRSSFF